MLKKLFLTILSAVLLAMPWWGMGGWSLFIAFVPLLLLSDMRPRYYWLWAALCFTLWNVSTTWWVGIATPVATFGIPVGSLFFTLLPWMIFHRFRFRAPKAIGWGIFVTIWIAFEALFLNNEISFPWLMLGNGFANNIRLVQWYEITGAFGGTLWVLVGNILCYYLWLGWKQKGWRVALPALLWIVLPMIGSLIRYGTYEEEENPVKVAVVQPNFDPYLEKFSGLSFASQRDIILDLASEAPRDVQFIITPETAFDDNFWLGPGLLRNPTVDTIRRFMAAYPRAEFIAGATTWLLYTDDMESRRWTHTHRQTGERYDVFNSALGIRAGRPEVEVYHKSILVVGAEQFPYPKVFGLLKFLDIDLGGFSGNYGRQEERSLFRSPEDVRAGVAICYESIYGEYFTEYVQKGAQIMFVITNDGWWDDTPGYRQHFSYARLRAVETRRAIARSANTGISGYINQRGDVLQSAGWDEEALLVDEINASDRMTFYVRYGDYIVRISLLLLALCVLYTVSWNYRRRSLLVDE